MTKKRGGNFLPYWSISCTESRGLTKRQKVKFAIWQICKKYLFQTSPHIMRPWRVFLLRSFGADIGDSCYISPSVDIQAPWNLHISNRCSIDDGCVINGMLYMDDNSSIAKYCMLIPDGHNVRSRKFEYYSETIRLGASCFIGAGVFIGKGVEIGQFTCIGSHSHVLKDIPENTIAYGTPCVSISNRLPNSEYKNYRYK